MPAQPTRRDKKNRLSWLNYYIHLIQQQSDLQEIDLSHLHLNDKELAPLFAILDDNPTIKSSLVTIDLSINNTTEICLSGYTSLRVLRIRYNYLRTLPKLNDFCSLEVIDLHSNSIKEAFIPINACPRLKVLNLGNNPLYEPPSLNLHAHPHLIHVDLSETLIPDLSKAIFLRECLCVNSNFSLTGSTLLIGTQFFGVAENNTQAEQRMLAYFAGHTIAVRDLMIKSILHNLVILQRATHLCIPIELRRLLVELLIGKQDAMHHSLLRAREYFPEKEILTYFMYNTDYNNHRQRYNNHFEQLVNAVPLQATQWQKILGTHRTLRMFMPHQLLALFYRALPVMQRFNQQDSSIKNVIRLLGGLLVLYLSIIMNRDISDYTSSSESTPRLLTS